MLLFKLDIKKAFDSVRWDYLMEMLSHHGFPTCFRDWISAILSSASSRVLLNGIASDLIKHDHGLRPDHPMSPLLFVLAIDLLYHVLNQATSQSFTPLGGTWGFVPHSTPTTLPFFVPPSRRTFNSSPPCSHPSASPPASSQTTQRVLLLPSDMAALILMIFFSPSRRAIPPSLFVTLASLSLSKG